MKWEIEMKALLCVGIILALSVHVLTALVVFGNADSKIGGSDLICLYCCCCCCCYCCHLVTERKENSGWRKWSFLGTSVTKECKL